MFVFLVIEYALVRTTRRIQKRTLKDVYCITIILVSRVDKSFMISKVVFVQFVNVPWIQILEGVLTLTITMLPTMFAACYAHAAIQA
jgi:hypothetical protein